MIFSIACWAYFMLIAVFLGLLVTMVVIMCFLATPIRNSQMVKDTVHFYIPLSAICLFVHLMELERN